MGLVNGCCTALAGIDYFYPNFYIWYHNKVVPDLHNGTRQLSVIKDSNQIVAVGIFKKYENEKKICTIWVHPNYRGRGYGSRRIDQALKYLEDDKPLLTIPYEKDKDFQPLIAKYGFKKYQSVIGLYRPNSVECIYNK